MQQELEITTADIYDRESDSELDEILDSEYYPSSSDSETSDSEEDEEPKPLEKTGVIYRLTAEGCDKCYIGSTVNLKNRISNHEHRFNKGVGQCSAKLIMVYGNYTFTEIASLLYTDIKQLRRLEADIILEHGDKVVNIRETKDSQSKEYKKEYQKNDSYKANQKEYKKKKYFCEGCKKEYLVCHKARHFKTKKHISKSK